MRMPRQAEEGLWAPGSLCLLPARQRNNWGPHPSRERKEAWGKRGVVLLCCCPLAQPLGPGYMSLSIHRFRHTLGRVSPSLSTLGSQHPPGCMFLTLSTPGSKALRLVTHCMCVQLRGRGQGPLGVHLSRSTCWLPFHTQHSTRLLELGVGQVLLPMASAVAQELMLPRARSAQAMCSWLGLPEECVAVTVVAVRSGGPEVLTYLCSRDP